MSQGHRPSSTSPYLPCNGAGQQSFEMFYSASAACGTITRSVNIKTNRGVNPCTQSRTNVKHFNEYMLYTESTALSVFSHCHQKLDIFRVQSTVMLVKSST